MKNTPRLILIGVVAASLAVIISCTCNCETGCNGDQIQKCSSCKTSWHGPYCQKKNVALNGNASQQGLYRTADASLAVDGNTNTDYHNGSCSHADSRNNSWWSVQLGDNGINQIKYMTIYHRKDTPENHDRRMGMEILIGGQRCIERGDYDEAEVVDDVTCNETLTGNNLTIIIPRHYLSLCEVQVFVCSNGWFGKDCDQRCKCRDLDDTCDKISGACSLGCAAGYTGDDCQTPCVDGKKKLNCSQNCGLCSNNLTCNTTNGHCPSECDDGVEGEKCDMCIDGRYGQNCSFICGHCSNNQTCNKTNGHCPGACDEGWHGEKCIVCSEGFFGRDCEQRCKCRDSNDTCDKITGKCNLGCAAGFTGDDCQTPCVDGRYGLDCSETCGNCSNNQTCNKTNGDCPGACDEGWHGKKCIGRTWARCKEVKCSNAVCSEGFFGRDCEQRCKCRDSNDTCDKITGKCNLGCAAGFTGDDCQTPCVDGRYGLDCSETCGNCSNNQTCNKTNGDCPGACDEGWHGKKCIGRTWARCKEVKCSNAVCSEGFFGRDCEQRCKCRDSNDTCDKITGKCNLGCAAGFTGDDCQTPCVDGRYGLDCSETCGNCSNNQTCNKTNGDCPGACDEGWHGKKCIGRTWARCKEVKCSNAVCSEGFFGRDCEQRCKCRDSNDTCDKITGKCNLGCAAGFTGDDCQTPCVDGRYGLDCSETCGNCSNNQTCNKTNGDCPGACDEGWHGKKCIEILPKGCAAKNVQFEHRTLQIPETSVQSTYITQQTCFTDDKPLGKIACVVDGTGEAVWEDFRLNLACNFSSYDRSEISKALLDLLMDNTNNTKIETVVMETGNITKDKNLTQLDVIYTTSILEKISHLQEVPATLVQDVAKLSQKVCKFASTSDCEDGKKGVQNRMLKILDFVAVNMELPGPRRISTDSFESEVFDVNNTQDQEFPFGLTSVDVPNTSFVALLSSPVDISKTDTSIALTKDFIDSLIKEKRGRRIRLFMSLHRNPHLTGTCGKLRLISKVISMTILVDGRPVTDLEGSHVTFTMKTKKAIANEKHVCGYWDFRKGWWSTDGCNHTGYEAGRDVCVCNHLTNFAILLDIEGMSEESQHNMPLTAITMIGLTVSIAGLFITTASYILFRNLMKSNPDKTLFHLSLSQLCAWTVFLAGFNQTQSYGGCVLVAVLLHYFIMASFLWMLAEAVLYFTPLVLGHTARTRTSSFMITFGVLAWGLPALPVTILLAIDVDLYRGRQEYCWMSQTTSLYAFAAPVGLVILFNLLLYLLTVFSICRRGDVSQKKAGETSNRKNVWASFVFFILFGLSWLFGYLAVAEGRVLFQYIFCATASTQGFLIFLLFTARNKKVRESWWTLCCRKPKPVENEFLVMQQEAQWTGNGNAGSTAMETKETLLHVSSGNGRKSL